jgi:hypothetical protein
MEKRLAMPRDVLEMDVQVKLGLGRSQGRRIEIYQPDEAVSIPLTSIPLTSFCRLEKKAEECWSEE